MSKRAELGQFEDIRQFQSRRIRVNIRVLGLIPHGKPCPESSERAYRGSRQFNSCEISLRGRHVLCFNVLPPLTDLLRDVFNLDDRIRLNDTQKVLLE